jgi:hypothetical protein
MTDRYDAALARQGLVVRVNGYGPWALTQPSSAMLRIVDGEEGRLIPFATIIEVGYSVEASGEVGQVTVTCAERFIRISGNGLQGLVAALQHGEVNVIRVWDPADYPSTSIVPYPRVNHMAVVRRGKV